MEHEAKRSRSRVEGRGSSVPDSEFSTLDPRLSTHSMIVRRWGWASCALVLLGCGGPRGFALYPERPAPNPGAPISDPPPSRIVLHASVARAALEQALDQAVPKNGGGTFPL